MLKKMSKIFKSMRYRFKSEVIDDKVNMNYTNMQININDVIIYYSKNIYLFQNKVEVDIIVRYAVKDKKMINTKTILEKYKKTITDLETNKLRKEMI